MTEPPSERLCVGVLSGTSADAAEACVCHITGSGASVRVKLLSHESLPLARELTDRIHDEHLTPLALAELHAVLGELFAEAALKAISAAGLHPSQIDVIGSHGQTVAHIAPTSPVPSTLQIGSPAIIAERTGRPVVSDFRSRDMAVGGQGAPLVPYFDWALFRTPDRPRALLNLGGIGNVSVVSARLEDTLAFDTGPANMVLDALARRATGGVARFDRDGRMAAQGQVIEGLLGELLENPYFAAPPPKSAGRELFGDALVAQLWARYPGRAFDLLATALAFSVEATARSFETFIYPRAPASVLKAVYVSGGGIRNPLLFEALKRRMLPLVVEPLDALGFPEGAREAALFALLANEHLAHLAANVPSATGARRSVVLGSFTP